MKNGHKLVFACCCVAAGVLSLHFLGPEAVAAEEASSWRPGYDLALRYINFGILVFVFLKYGKTPLLNFLRGEKDKVARQIDKIESKKKVATDKIKESRQALEEGQARFVELKARIVQQGERKKEEIVQDARQRSVIMIEDTKQKIGFQITQAKSTIREELLDAAIAFALEKLPKEITVEDNQRFVDQYLARAEKK
jgi:F-type H+-transporting ATPase subunit b